MSRTKKIVAIIAVMAMVLMMVPAAMFADNTTTAAADSNRLAGADRIGTALAICGAYGSSASAVVLAPSNPANLVDALAAAPLAGQLKAPILLTDKNSLNADVKAKIAALGATKVYVIGAISDAVVAEVNTISGVTATKLAGAGRIATADAINAQLTSPAGTFVVGFNAVADALSVASFAAANNYKIVLANADGTVDSSKVTGTVYIVGGTAVVKDLAGATRLAGDNRFATNKDVISKLGFKLDKAYLANGLTLADALAAAPLAALTTSPIVLTDGSTVAASDLVKNSQIIALGGTASVPDSVINSFSQGPIKEITSVAGVSGKIYDVNKDTQSLAFTVNGGRTISLDDLYALGYEIEFDASESVFDDDGFVDTSKSGDLDSDAMKDVYQDGDGEDTVDYTVTITKDGEVVDESDSASFKLVDGDNAAASVIDSYKLFRDNDGLGSGYKYDDVTGNRADQNDIEITSGTLVLDESYVVDDIIGDSVAGDKNVNITTGATLSSSDEDVVTVDDLAITPVGEGTAKITIESGSAEKSFSVTVKDVDRKAYAAKLNGDPIKVAEGHNYDRDAIAITDQFGDPFVGINGQDFKVDTTSSIKNSSGNPIADVVGDRDPKDCSPAGTYPFCVVSKGTPLNSDATSYTHGTGSFKVYKKDSSGGLTVPMLTVNITVASGDSPSSYKLEWADNPDSANATIDLNGYSDDINKDNHVNLVVNAYTSSGAFIGPVTYDDYDTTSTPLSFAISTTDKPIVTTTGLLDDGRTTTSTLTATNYAGIRLTAYEGTTAGKKAFFETGTTTVTAKFGTHKLSKTVTVKNTGATFNGIDFSDLDGTGAELLLSDLVDPDDLTINGDAGNTKVAYKAIKLNQKDDFDCILIYVDSNYSGDFEPLVDVAIGYVKATAKDGVKLADDGVRAADEAYVGLTTDDAAIHFESGTDDSGSATINFYKWGSNSVFKSKTIDVDL